MCANRYRILAALVILPGIAIVAWLCPQGRDKPSPELFPAPTAAPLGNDPDPVALDEILVLVQERHAARRRIALDLVAGRMTLLEAGARFRVLNSGPPVTSEEAFYLQYPGHCLEERLYRQVIRFVERELADRSPDEVTEVVARLERELEEYLCRAAAETPQRP